MAANSLSTIIRAHDHQVTRGQDLHNDPLNLQNPSMVLAIAGRKGAGKSSALLSLLSSKKAWRKRFDSLYLISPTAHKDGKFHRLVEELREDGRYYDELSEDIVQRVFSEIEGALAAHKGSAKNKPKACVVFDDCACELPRSRQSFLNRCTILSRHYRCTIVFITQQWNLLSTTIRRQVDGILYFPSANQKELETLQDDLAVPKEVFRHMVAAVQNSGDSTDFLYVNCAAVPPQFYKKFDRLTYPGSE